MRISHSSDICIYICGRYRLESAILMKFISLQVDVITNIIIIITIFLYMYIYLYISRKASICFIFYMLISHTDKQTNDWNREIKWEGNLMWSRREKKFFYKHWNRNLVKKRIVVCWCWCFKLRWEQIGIRF